jgi:hypothetical protein
MTDTTPCSPDGKGQPTRTKKAQPRKSDAKPEKQGISPLKKGTKLLPVKPL